MRRKVAGAVVVLVAGVACAACGSGSPRTTTTMSAPRTVTVRLPVTQRIAKVSGAGNRTLHTFAYHGNLSLALSCTGRGNLKVLRPGNDLSTIRFCPEPPDGFWSRIGPAGNGAHQAHITIQAPPHVHWTMAARESYTKSSVVPTGVQQLPIRRSGIGPEPLGTFAMTHGWLYIAATCVGKGTFRIWFNRPEVGISAPCLNSKRKATLKDVSSGVTEHRVRIDVDAPSGMKWTVVVFAGPTPSKQPDDPTNVWR